MIEIKVDGQDLKSIIRGLEQKIRDAENKIATQSTEFKDLQAQIIEIQKEEIKERRSLWQFLTDWRKTKVEKREESRDSNKSRLTESTVNL